MLWTICVLLIVLWLLGLVSSSTMGGLIMCSFSLQPASSAKAAPAAAAGAVFQPGKLFLLYNFRRYFFQWWL